MEEKVDTLEVQTIKYSSQHVKVKIPKNLKVLGDNEQPANGWRVFRVMTPRDGDKRIVWDSRSLAQIADAKAMFDKLIQEGLVPYKVGVDGKASAEVMDEFDAAAEEVVFLPIQAVAGG